MLKDGLVRPETFPVPLIAPSPEGAFFGSSPISRDVASRLERVAMPPTRLQIPNREIQALPDDT